MIEMSAPRTGDVRARVAVVSLHTSPLDQPGTGDSGGMNVYIREVAGRLARRGVAVDVFTRCAGRGVPEVENLGPLTRVIQVNAGPCAPVPKDELPALVPLFVSHVMDRYWSQGRPYDLIHAHYWLSGSVGTVARSRWSVPLVASFHTLGEVKNRALSRVAWEPPARLLGERQAIMASDRILAPTPLEAEHLKALYGAPADRIRIVPPGVDNETFRPRPKEEARDRLGLGGSPRVVMFLGRIQPLKGPDVAIRTVAEAIRRDESATRGLVLAVVGGPSGSGGISQLDSLADLARSLGIGDRVRFLAPRPHEELPWVYSAADVLLMPSRSESFGLAALEAQACGVPVVASVVGGLRYVVADRRSGFLVEGHDPRRHATRLLELLREPELSRRLSIGAVEQAARYPWTETVEGVLDVYGELIPELDRTAVA
jgi:D-inositol-3-phosphate glycosyltransferase